MSRKKKARQVQRQRPPKTVNKQQQPNWHIAFILILTFLVYLPVWNAEFVNWDDNDYVLDNFLIRDFSRLPELLTTPVQGNHHPLTMLSLAFNYAISGDQAWSYHALNLVLHLVNCILVYRLVLLLSGNRHLVALITSLLFGIHPMHVESVAWVSERKDVLYSLFFLSGHISYIHYLDKGDKKQFWLTFLFLLLSLLSKPAAVIFPFSLLTIDILKNRKLSLKLLTEKILFIIPAIIMAYITMTEQKVAGATDEAYVSNIKNVLFGFYGIMMYAVKLVFPFNLSPFYPFPPVNESLPSIFYLAPLFSLLLIAAFIYGIKKNRMIAFGVGFYIVNLVLVLQVFSFGSAVISERYTYLPYIGLFVIAGWYIAQYAGSRLSKAYTLMGPVILLFSVLAYVQVQKWKNGAALWDSAIKNTPSSRAYSSRATLYEKDGQLQTALSFYHQAIHINKGDNEAYNNRGNVYYKLNQLDSAYQDYRSALNLNPDYYVTFDNLGSLFATINRMDSALYYLDKAIERKPDYEVAYKNRGVVLLNLQRYNEALRDWMKYLEYFPDDPIVFNTIGICYQKTGQDKIAIDYFNKAISLNPMGPFFLNRSYSHFNMNNIAAAINDVHAARQAGMQVPDDYMRTLGLIQN